MGSINYLNKFGDITIAWEDSGDAEMLKVIQRQMDAGISFWQIEPRFGGILPPKKRILQSVDDIKDERILSMGDEDFFKMVADGIAGAVKVEKKRSGLSFIKRLRTPKEVVKAKSSAAMNPVRGG